MFSRNLFRAVKKCDTDLAVELIHAGSNPNIIDKWGWSPLMYASKTGDLKLVQLLLDNDACVHGPVDVADHRFPPPLEIAVRSGRIEVARQLLNGGAEIFFYDYSDSNIFELAAESGDPKFFHLLLTHCKTRYLKLDGQRKLADIVDKLKLEPDSILKRCIQVSETFGAEVRLIFEDFDVM